MLKKHSINLNHVRSAFKLMKIKTRSESEMSRIKLAKAWLNFNDGETAKLKIKILIKLNKHQQFLPQKFCKKSTI